MASTLATIAIAAAALTACGGAMAVAADSPFVESTGTISFTPEGGPHPSLPITVWYHRPEGVELNQLPILIVIHGSSRNADEYRDAWIDEADRHGALLLVPEFTEVYTSRQFNQGNLRGPKSDGPSRLNPKPEWTFLVVEGLFQWARAETGGQAGGYYLYGHSAGAQLVHRLMLYMNDHHVVRAVAANAGWYTVPDPTVRFPYGAAEGPPIELDRALAEPMIIAVGTGDDDPQASGLRTTARAREQGRSRYERGHFFYQSAEKQAADLGVTLGWELVEVIAVGHSNEQMAPSAARLLFEPDDGS